MERVDERHLTLENYHEAFGEYERYYRLLSAIHPSEGETAAEIRQVLHEKYGYGPLAETITV